MRPVPDRRIIYRAQNRCVKCGEQDDRTISGKWYCDSCAEERRYYQQKYTARSVELYHQRKAAGLCPKCGSKRDNETTWCSFCRAKQAQAGKLFEPKRKRRCRNQEEAIKRWELTGNEV